MSRISIKKRLLLHTLAAFILFLTACSAETGDETQTSADASSATLTPGHSLEDRSIALDGSWHFYWEELLTPEDIQNRENPVPYMVPVPSDWNQYELDNNQIPRHGYATYHINVVISSEDVSNPLSLYIPSAASAYKLWINGGQKAVSLGQVGTSGKEEEPAAGPKFVTFQPDSESIDIIIQVSNFNQRKSGIFDSILIGDPETVTNQHETNIIFRTLIVASLLALGLYYISIFSLRRYERSLIYFGTACIAVSIRAVTIEETLAQTLLPFLSWEMLMKIEYLGATIGTIFFSLFVYTRYRHFMRKSIIVSLVSALALHSVFVIVTPAVIHTMTMLFMQILILISFAYLIYVYIAAFIKNYFSMLMTILALLFFFATIAHDVLYYNDVIQSVELSSVGMLAFLLSQSFNLSRDHAKAVHSIGEMTTRLTELNESLEKQVDERTSQLRLINDELQDTNLELQKAHDSQKRLLSNISHELGTPLTSLKGYIQSINEGIIPPDKRYMTIINEKVEYLTQIFHDLESITDINSKTMDFHLKELNSRSFFHSLFEKYITDVNRDNVCFSITDEILEEKPHQISIDSYRIEQVFVNLLTNAQKAIQRNGNIMLHLSINEKNDIVVQFSDTGIGLNDEEVPFLFERFYRGEGRNKTPGAGLGLSISKEIIERHGGNIGAYSNHGYGSTFYFTLPGTKNENSH